MRLAENLSLLVKRQNISVSSLAKKTNIPNQTIHNWINGYNPQNIDHLKQIANFFNVTIDQLCFSSIDEIESDHSDPITHYTEEINAGLFEVILRRTNKKN